MHRVFLGFNLFESSTNYDRWRQSSWAMASLLTMFLNVKHFSFTENRLSPPISFQKYLLVCRIQHIISQEKSKDWKGILEGLTQIVTAPMGVQTLLVINEIYITVISRQSCPIYFSLHSCCVTLKRAQRSLSLSFQQRDWWAGPHQSLFWYDTDYRIA